MRQRRREQTLADYVVIALSPALIMLLVGSLVYFLQDIFYRGDHPQRLMVMLGLFVFGQVLVARIGIEDGIAHSQIYGFALLGAAGLFCLKFIPLFVPAMALLGLVAWCSWCLTRDCTLIDDSVDASGEGLLQAALDPHSADSSVAPTGAQASHPAGDQPVRPPPPRPVGPPSSQESTFADPWERVPLSERLARANERRQAAAAESGLPPVDPVEPASAGPRRRSRGTSKPGTWVIYFSLAALPLFGVGQMFIPSTDVLRRRYSFQLLVVYVAAALGLLLTTSFLGLRRYLRQRNLQMPAAVTRSWLGWGSLVGLLVLVGAILFPRPQGEYSVTDWVDRIDRQLTASNFAVLPGEAGQGPGRVLERARPVQPPANGNAPQPPGGPQGMPVPGPPQAAPESGAARPPDPPQAGQPPPNPTGDPQASPTSPNPASAGRAPPPPAVGHPESEPQPGQPPARSDNPPGKQPTVGSPQSGGARAGQGQGQGQGQSRNQGPPSSESRPGDKTRNVGDPSRRNDLSPSPQRPAGDSRPPGENSNARPAEDTGEMSDDSSKPSPGNEPASSPSDTSPPHTPNNTKPAGGRPQAERQGQPAEASPNRAGPPPEGPDRAPSPDPGNRPANPPVDNRQNRGQPPGQPPVTPPNSPAAPPSQGLFTRLLQSLGQFGGWFKWLFYGLLAAAGLWILIRHGHELWNLIMSLLGRGRDTPSAGPHSTPSPPPPPPRPFADFHNPFATGAARRMPLRQLAGYTFEALEAWAREARQPRGEEQTPAEFAEQIARRKPQWKSEVTSAAEMYSQVAYAGRDKDPQGPDVFERLWRRLDESAHRSDP